jgi:hypothetical protein
MVAARPGPGALTRIGPPPLPYREKSQTVARTKDRIRLLKKKRQLDLHILFKNRFGTPRTFKAFPQSTLNDHLSLINVIIPIQYSLE